MWSRRVLRAGWLIAPVFALPRRAYRSLLCNDEGDFSAAQAFLTGAVSGTVVLFALMIYDMATEHNPASAEAVVSAMARDECMADLVPRRAKDKGTEPLSNRDLWIAGRDCDKAAEDYYAQLEQQKALQSQATVLGGKP